MILFFWLDMLGVVLYLVWLVVSIYFSGQRVHKLTSISFDWLVDLNLLIDCNLNLDSILDGGNW